MIGRRAELAQLRRLLQEASAGDPRVCFVFGEAGIGKSRLISELLAIAPGDTVTLRGVCDPEISIPYSPLGMALGPLISLLQQSTEQINVPPAVEAIATLGAQDTDTEPQPIDSAQVVNWLVSVASRQPLVLVMEDLHWADQATMDVFSQLVLRLSASARLERPRMFILASWRTGSLDVPIGAFQSRLARLQREPISRSIELLGLSEPETRELLVREGMHPANELLPWIADLTGGNPLFIRHLSPGGETTSALAEANFEVSMPADILVAIARLIDRIDPAVQQVLSYAAYLPEPFHLSAARAATAQPDLPDNFLDPAITEGIIRREGEAFAFTHPLIRDHLNQKLAITPAAKREVHQQLATRIDAQSDAPQPEQSIHVAHHLLRAGSRADPALIRRHAVRAADVARTAMDWTRAAEFSALAISATQDTQSHDYARLNYQTGLAFYRAHLQPSSVPYLRVAADLASQYTDWRLGADALLDLSNVMLSHSADQASINQMYDELTAFLTAVPVEEHGIRAAVLGTLSEFAFGRGEAERAITLGEDAWAAAEQSGDDVARLLASFALGLARMNRFELDSALHWYRICDAYCQSVPDPWFRSWASGRLPMLLWMLGDLDAARDAAGNALQLSGATGNWSELSLASACLAGISAASGQFDDAERYAYDAILTHRIAVYRFTPGIALPVLAYVRAMRGDFSSAREPLVQQDRALVQMGWGADYRRSTATLETERLIDHLAGRPASTDTRPPRHWSASMQSASAVGISAELASHESDAELGAHCLTQLQAALDQSCAISIQWPVLLARAAALAAAASGDTAVARQHFQDAISTGDRSGARPEAARARLEFASLLAQVGSEDATEQAIALLEEATREFSALGMSPFLSRARNLATRLNTAVTIPPVRQISNPDNLTPREIEVLRAISHGSTNDQIAESLVIQPSTAKRHVANIFDKINVANRAAAVAYCIEHGLHLEPDHPKSR